MILLRRAYFLRLCAAVLLGSIGAGLATPALAFGDLADRLSAEGIAPEALDVAMDAAAESETPAEVAHAVTVALGDSAPAPEMFLQALYGHLYQFLRFQQGAKAVSASSVATPQILGSSLDGLSAEGVGYRVPVSGITMSDAVENVPRPLPRAQHPAVQPLGP